MTAKPNPTPELRSQIPHGVQDRFLVEAVRRRRAEADLCEAFARWGYQEVIPPTFEYHENLTVGASAELQRAMYRFFDHEGRTLALRADFTPQIARIAATKLFDQPLPLRCFYVGSLFRREEPQAGRKREFTQAGVELLGADTAAADAEVVALSVAALEALHLRDFQVNLGQMAFFRALTGDLPRGLLVFGARGGRSQEQHRARPRPGAKPVWAAARRDLLCRLPDLIGGPEILDEARALSRRPAAGAGCPAGPGAPGGNLPPAGGLRRRRPGHPGPGRGAGHGLLHRHHLPGRGARPGLAHRQRRALR